MDTGLILHQPLAESSRRQAAKSCEYLWLKTNNLPDVFFCRGALSRSMSSWLIPSMKCLPHLLAMCHKQNNYQWLPTTLRLHIFWSPDCFIFLHVASFGHPGGVEQTPWAIHSKHFKLGERGGGLAADQWASAEPDLLAKQCKTYMPSTGHAETSGKEEDENKKRANSTFEGKSGHSMVDCRTIRSVMTDPPHPMPDIFKNGKLWFLRGRVRQDSILWCCAEGCWRTGKIQSLHRTFGSGPGLVLSASIKSDEWTIVVSVLLKFSHMWSRLEAGSMEQ